jgi:5-methylcytosine-specific restriction endonuclease McrA
MKSISRIVEKVTGITVQQLQNKSRKRDNVEARVLFVGLGQTAGYSANSMGKYLKRDHTTILHLQKKIKGDEEKKRIIEKFKYQIDSPITPNAGKNKKYEFVYRKFEGKCAVCKHSSVTEVCHIHPKSLGGTDDITNLILLCPTHHAMFDKGLLFIKDINIPD